MLSISTIHERIEEVCIDLEELVTKIANAGHESSVSEAAFKCAFAKERLRVRAQNQGQKITVDEVEDRATLATADERQRFLIASGVLMASREALKATTAQLDALRSLLASHRSAGG